MSCQSVSLGHGQLALPMNRLEHRRFSSLRTPFLLMKARKKPPAPGALPPPKVEHALLHELQVDQIELKMRNEELRRTRMELEASRARYVELYDFMPVGCCTVDEEGLVLQANLALAALLGVARGAVNGKPFTRFIFQDDQDPFYLLTERILAARATGAELTVSARSCELRLQPGEGPPVWTSLVATTATDESGETVLCLGVNDISARRAREADALQKTSLQAAILDAIPAHVALVDPEGVIQVTNESWRRFATANLLQGPEFSLGQNYLKVCDRAIGPCSEEAKDAAVGIRRVLRGEAHDFTLEYPCHSPTERRWFRLMVTSLHAGVIESGAVVMHVNITERKEAEMKLVRASELLERTGGLAKIGGWEVHLPTRKLTWTRETFRIAEIEPPVEPPLAEGINLFAPEARPTITAAVQAAIDTGTPYDLELPLITAKGNHRWVQTQGFAEMIEGKVVRIYGTFQDITERKHAELALQKLELRARAIIDASPVPMAVNDYQQRITYLNPAFTATFGYTLADIPTLADWWPKGYPDPAYRQWVAEAWQAELSRSAQTGTAFVPMELLIRCKDGTERFVMAGAAPLEDSYAGNHLVVLHDFTKRKQADQLLVENQARLTEAMDQARLVYWEQDEATRTFLFDDRFYALYGTTAEAEGGYRMPMEVYAREFLPPEEQHLVGDCMSRLLASGRDDFRVEHHIRRRDGELRHIIVRISLVRDAAGNITGTRGSNQDVTEIRAALAALRDSEAHFRLLYENSPYCVHEIDQAGRLQLMNRAGLKIMGVEDERAICGLPYLSAVAAVDQERVGRLMQLAFQGQVAEFEFTGSNGSSFKSSFVPILNAQGVVTRLMGLSEDITERKRAEAALHDREALLRSIIDSTPAHIFAFDLEHRFTLSNTMMARDFGLTPQAVNGKTLHDVFPPVLAEVLLATNRRIIASGKLESLEEIIPDDTGQMNRIMSSMKFPLVNAAGKTIGLAGVVMDITARKRAEEALRKQQALLLSISEGTTDAVFVKDLQGRYQLFNTAASRFVGKPVEEVLGKDDMAIFPLEVGRAIMARDRQVMASGRTQTSEEIVRMHSGEQVIFLATKGPMLSSMGKVVGLFGISRDITERRNLEQQLRESQKMEAIGRLAGGIAHDFNNILTGILGHVDLAEMDRPSPELAESLRVIKKGGQRASELVRQILTFSRRQEAKRVPLRLELAVEEVIKLLRVAVPRGIKFEISMDRTPTVLADATQIHQVIMNLGNNAAYAMADRPGTLTISVTECEVDAALARHRPDLHPGRYVRLSVADTGCGMDPTTLQRVFEPFYTTKPVGEGTGLGLAVVHGIMKSHDGGILLESQLGRGTTFHLYFPVFGGEAMPPAAGMSDLPRGRGEHILIVDDEEILVKLGQRVLERLGYRVTIQTCPQAAVAAVQADPAAFDLVLTDLAMPEMSGDELAKAVLAIRPGLPIILMTGFNTLVHEEKSQWLGFSGYLSKPYATRTLAEMLRQLLNKSNAPDA